MDRSSRRDVVLLDFRGIEPTPERLLEIVDASIARADSRIAIDWGDRLPWSLDTAVRRRVTYPESLVAAVGERIARSGCRLSFVVRTLLPPGYASRAGYRHLDRARRGRTSEWTDALEKLSSDLLDDLQSLMPGLSDLELLVTAREEEIIRRAAACAGIVCHLEDLPPTCAERDARLGGIEERLSLTGHQASLARGFPDLHASLRRWRSEGWMLVGDLSDDLVRASRDSACGSSSVASMKRLSAHLRDASRIRASFERAYRGIATGTAIRCFLHEVVAPVREQYGHLAARVSTVRIR